MTHNANQLVTLLINAEAFRTSEPDARRMIREERQALQVAIESGKPSAIKQCMVEAINVARMWKVDLA